MARSEIRVLIVNPNATEAMTDACYAMAQPTLPPDVKLGKFTCPRGGPTAIEGMSDALMSAVHCFAALKPILKEWDAFLVACYSDHPLIYLLREETDAPVCGIMEASLYAARTLGFSFGIVSLSPRAVTMHIDGVRRYGLEKFCTGVKGTGLGVLELESMPRAEVLDRLANAGEELVREGAEVLTLGCAGMSDMKEAVEKAVGPTVIVLDG